MRQILNNLSIGLALAIFVILLLLAANFECIRLPLIGNWHRRAGRLARGTQRTACELPILD
jgi:hypothetical protein